MNARHAPTFGPTEDDRAAYEADMLAFERAAREALAASLTRPLTPAEADAIAWWAMLPSPGYVPPKQPSTDGTPF